MSEVSENMKKWEAGYRIVIECTVCGAKIHSKYPGEFIGCDCEEGGVFIDQTPYYSRIGGEPGRMIVTELLLYPGEDIKDTRRWPY